MDTIIVLILLTLAGVITTAQYELVKESKVRNKEEIRVGDYKYTCEPTEATIKIQKLEKEIEELR